MALLTASLSRRPLPALHPWLLLLHPHPRPLRLPLPLLLLPHPLLLRLLRLPLPPRRLLPVPQAMKMENEIVAPQDGTVASINVHKGDTVNSGDTLVSMN